MRTVLLVALANVYLLGLVAFAVLERWRHGKVGRVVARASLATGNLLASVGRMDHETAKRPLVDAAAANRKRFATHLR